MLGRVADLTWKRPKLVLALVAAFAVLAAVVGRDAVDHLLAAGFADSASESERATEVLRGSLGYDANPGIVVLVRPRGGGRLDTRDPGTRREVARLARELGRTVNVASVVNPLVDRKLGAELIARDGRSLVLSGHLSIQDVEDAGGDTAKEAKRKVRSDRLDISLSGFAPSFQEVNDQTREDLVNAELIAFPLLAILLLIVFRGVIAASIPLVIGGLSVLSAFLALRVMSGFVDTSIFALNIATALSLGLAVDYALLLVSRYREELARDGPTREAHRRTVQAAGRTVLFSGLTVAVAMAALTAMPQRFLYSVGAAGAVVGVAAATLALLVVPSLLALLGNRINALAIRRGPTVSDESGGWYRLARAVMRRPVAVALGSAGLMLAVAAPLVMTVLTGPSAEAIPPGQPSYEPGKYIASHYPRDVTEATTVTVRGAASGPQLDRYARSLRSVDGITRGTPFTRASRDVAFANFALADKALAEDSRDAVRELRGLPPPPGSTRFVSGNTARFVDEKESLATNAPLVLGVIALSTLVLLFLLTGSVLLPLKTLVMNGLTLAATLGILVLGFQEGWLTGVLDYTGPSAIEVTSLVFLAVVTFALATDYAVLVMSRIKEHHDQGLSNEESVARGIGRTGRIITAAAGLIAVVFLAFAVSPVFFMKEIAVGMALGVVIDATIVRALLVPSLMRLLGEANWWAPAPLKRLYKRIGLEG